MSTKSVDIRFKPSKKQEIEAVNKLRAEFPFMDDTSIFKFLANEYLKRKEAIEKDMLMQASKVFGITKANDEPDNISPHAMIKPLNLDSNAKSS
jgi:hypothetical protein